jgi:hypothetical protein
MIEQNEHPKFLSVRTVDNPDRPTAAIITVSFQNPEFEEWATKNPTASFRVPFEDGSPSPCVISAAFYLEAKRKQALDKSPSTEQE